MATILPLKHGGWKCMSPAEKSADDPGLNQMTHVIIMLFQTALIKVSPGRKIQRQCPLKQSAQQRGRGAV